MDIRKLFNELVKCEELQDIPVMYIMKVLTATFELISSGKFFYDTETE